MKMIRSCLSLLSLAAVAIAGPRQPSPPALTYLFSLNITSGATISIGSTPLGDRVFEPITGGSFSGPKLSGKSHIGRSRSSSSPARGLLSYTDRLINLLIVGTVAAGGADWALVDGNGSFNPDVVYVLQTHDGGNILVREKGHAPNLLLLFETGSDEYDWLNSVVAYGQGSQVPGGGVSLDVWQVSIPLDFVLA